MAPRLKKWKRLKTPLNHITSSNKVRYIKQEKRALKYIADNDLKYKNTLMRGSLLK
jgi:hypothetical protein